MGTELGCFELSLTNDEIEIAKGVLVIDMPLEIS
jgi:hypothetical protein